ncbi:hypothetical protein EM6_0314 [Asticcacaulis excentricus]|uniref:Uncharacterized protein n=1 Tax=Asticcacaulis excentricus TaxID=78587 RepID=A0A3G9G3V6_9CAUL|nr:hypothetical protein EM6_0314 [Asticcacaulis excentricus]
MIEQFYAAHIKDRIDAQAVNVRKEKKLVRGRSVPETDIQN